MADLILESTFKWKFADLITTYPEVIGFNRLFKIFFNTKPYNVTLSDTISENTH